MIKIGKIQTLTVSEESDSGYKLTDDSENFVFLPGSIAPLGLEIGGKLKVFVNSDNQGRPIATPEIPCVEVDSFAYLRVKEEAAFGFFFDWGISKDLLMPGNQKKEDIYVASSYFVRVCLDPQSNRIFATQRFEEYLKNENIEIHENQRVDIVPYQETPLGFNVVINDKYSGMIYHNEIFSEVSIGKKTIGYVKKIRDDHRIDVSINPVGMAGVRENTDFLLNALKESDGFLPITTYSSPEDVYKMFGISKLAFKKAFSALFKAGIVEKTENGIKLVPKK